MEAPKKCFKNRWKKSLSAFGTTWSEGYLNSGNLNVSRFLAFKIEIKSAEAKMFKIRVWSDASLVWTSAD